MTSPSYSISFSQVVSGTASVGGPGAVLIGDVTTGQLVLATTAARAGRRSLGMALSSFVPGGVVDVQQYGQVDIATAGLGAGTASWVRVSTTGTLERATPSGSDDVVGWVETDGTFHAVFGYLTAAIVNGGGGGFTAGGDLTGTSTSQTVAKVNGVTPAANVVTWFGTPSGANLATALTSALPVSKGGTGLTALTIPASALLVGTTDTQTLTNKTLTDPVVTVTGIDNATAGGTINDCTLSGTAGTSRRVRFTNASGPTITGFDATGVAQGTILYVYAAAGTLSITHEAAGSIAANRCTLQGGTAIGPAIGTVTAFMYLSDGVNSRWRHWAATAI